MRKQRLVAQHRVQQQPFIAVGARFAEGVRVIEVHVHRTDRYIRRRGHLGPEAQCNSLIRLNAYGEQVGLNLAAWPARLQTVKDQQRRLLELNVDLRGPLLQPLARAQIKRNACPAPVLDLHTHRGISLRARLGIDPVLVAITHHMLAVHQSRPVLAAHRVQDRNGRNRSPDFQLLSAHAVGLKTRRRLQRHKTQQLHHMVLHHVAQRARLLVERTAALHAQRLGHCNLHVINVIAVPYRLENSVGKPEHQKILHRLLAKIVIYAEDLILEEDSIYLAIQFAG